MLSIYIVFKFNCGMFIIIEFPHFQLRLQQLRPHLSPRQQRRFRVQREVQTASSFHQHTQLLPRNFANLFMHATSDGLKPKVEILFEKNVPSQLGAKLNGFVQPKANGSPPRVQICPDVFLLGVKSSKMMSKLPPPKV